MRALLRYLAWASAAVCILFGAASARAAVDNPFKTTSEPIVIRSDTLEVVGSKNTIVFKGNVNARGEGFEMQCREMHVYYTQGAAEGVEKGNPEGGIERILAIGSVQVIRKEGGKATAEKAEFFQKEDKVVLSGKAVLTQERDSVEGDTITIYIKENRVVVDATGESKVKATIFPKGRKAN